MRGRVAAPVGDVVVIVAKYPQAGKVKTRLGATIGHERAAALYTAFLHDLSARFTAGAQASGYDLRWACVDDTPDGDDQRKLRALLATPTAPDATDATDATDAPTFAHAQGGAVADVVPTVEAVEAVEASGPCVFAQRGADLAERLYNICVDMRAAGYRRVIIHGSDSPHAALGAVRDAFAALATHDVALGPATDGGYYLVGLHLDAPTNATPGSARGAGVGAGEPAEFPDLFRGVGMSEPTTLQQTLTRAHQLGLTVATVETTFDVDEAADLTRLANYLRAHGAQAAPQTAAALAELPELPQADSTGGSAEHEQRR